VKPRFVHLGAHSAGREASPKASMQRAGHALELIEIADDVDGGDAIGFDLQRSRLKNISRLNVTNPGKPLMKP
jgi:hypothetical protein